MSDEDVRIDFDTIKEVGDAYHITIDGKGCFVPQSLCRPYFKKKRIYMPEWIAEKKGLI